MAAGDITFFRKFREDVLEKRHDHENDSFKVGLIDSSDPPAATDADPRWGAGGTTDLSATEVAAGGNYAAGGPAIANPTVTESGGVATFDGDNISIAQNASNPTDARYGIIYNDTDAGKRAVAFVDLGAVINLSLGAFSISWNASGIFTLS